MRKVLADVVTPNRGTVLSLGFLATLWTASGGFAAAIEALNIAYDAEETRPFWKTRPLAMKEDAKDAAKDSGMKNDNTEHGHLNVTQFKMVSESCN